MPVPFLQDNNESIHFGYTHSAEKTDSLCHDGLGKPAGATSDKPALGQFVQIKALAGAGKAHAFSEPEFATCSELQKLKRGL